MEISEINHKIGIFMWYDNEIISYADNNYKINKIYCEKYGYTLIKSNERLYPNRKPHWERFSLLLKYFNEFDYLIWIDSDAHFFIDSPPISNIINSYPNKIFIISEDQHSGSNSVNSGVFIVKSCEEGRNILNTWGYDEDLFNKMNNHKGWNDQAILREMYRLNTLNIHEKSEIIKYGILQYFHINDKLPEKKFNLKNKPFIFHLAGSKKTIRIKHSTEYLQKYFLDKYKKFINSNIQLTTKVIHDIILETDNKNKKMLVFGLGYDSELWYNLTNKNTYFVENNRQYINLNKNIDENNIIFHEYKGINVKNSFNLSNDQIQNFEIPQKMLENAPYDIILIDGPNGFNSECPGRLLPIYWSKKYLVHDKTIIYIDDATRNLEKKCINKFFINNSKIFFKDRLGTMKINI